MSAEPQRPRAQVPVPAQFASWLELRTRNRDTDQFGHVNHAAIASLFEESRIALVFAPEFGHQTRGIDLVVASLTMDFHKELKAPGTVEVGAAVTRIGSSSLHMRQAIFADQTCYASAEALCVLIDSETRRPIATSDALRTRLIESR